MIVQYCKAIGIDVIEQWPLKKCWKGPDGKITHAELAHFVPGLPSRTNSEERDAILLMWNEATLPMKIKIKSNNCLSSHIKRTFIQINQLGEEATCR
jgi:hypothetical protein